MRFKKGELTYLKGLDGVRGLAVLMVVLFHIELIHKLFLPNAVFAFSNFDRFFIQIMELGWSGVDVFFVLSGFLITKILLNNREGDQVIKTFYWRRVLRIFPLYYFMLILYFMANSFFDLSQVKGSHFELYQSQQGYLWSHLSNFIRKDGILPTGELMHLWSLAVEEQFYLFIPWFIVKVPPKRLGLVLLLGILISYFFRISHVVAFDTPAVNTYAHTLARMEVILWGCLMAEMMEKWNGKSLILLRKYAKLAICFIFPLYFAIVYQTGHFQTQLPFNPWFSGFQPAIQIFGHTLNAFIVLAVLFLYLTGNDRAWLENRFLCQLGKYSYFIYLFHTLFIGGLILGGFNLLKIHQVLGLPFFLCFLFFALVILMISLLVGKASYKFIEAPFLRLKKTKTY